MAPILSVKTQVIAFGTKIRWMLTYDGGIHNA